MPPIISVENLGKRYTIRHQSSGGYRRFSEELVGVLSRPFRRKPISASPISASQPVSISASSSSPSESFWALRNVSFEVQQGEVLGIIGRNGAGKSTLLKVLSRITEPSEGRVRLRGRVASLLEVGTGFHPELSGRENVYLNGAVLGMSRAEIKRKFDEIVAFAGVEKFLDTPVKHYSSGMYVRLAFAVAAHLEPEILIVDEVLAVGDAEFQKKCLGKMKDVAGQGRTVLFVSHNMAAVQNLCDRVVTLARGAIVADGIPAKVIPLYVQGSRGDGSKWTREPAPCVAPLRFESAAVWLRGGIGAKKLCIDLELSSNGRHKPAFVAVDILDPLGTAVMQAIPKLSPFIYDRAPQHNLSVEVELPPLIPGDYLLTLWTGSHNTETLDQIEGQLRFEITESPIRNRTFPHTRDHGYVVPLSSVKYSDETASRISGH